MGPVNWTERIWTDASRLRDKGLSLQRIRSELKRRHPSFTVSKTQLSIELNHRDGRPAYKPHNLRQQQSCRGQTPEASELMIQKGHRTNDSAEREQSQMDILDPALVAVSEALPSLFDQAGDIIDVTGSSWTQCDFYPRLQLQSECNDSSITPLSGHVVHWHSMDSHAPSSSTFSSISTDACSDGTLDDPHRAERKAMFLAIMNGEVAAVRSSPDLPEELHLIGNEGHDLLRHVHIACSKRIGEYNAMQCDIDRLQYRIKNNPQAVRTLSDIEARLTSWCEYETRVQEAAKFVTSHYRSSNYATERTETPSCFSPFDIEKLSVPNV